MTLEGNKSALITRDTFLVVLILSGNGLTSVLAANSTGYTSLGYPVVKLQTFIMQ